MRDIDLLMQGFQEGLTKEALLPALRRLAPSFGAGAGIGAAAGGLGGAVLGGTRGYLQARQEDAAPLAAAGKGLEGAWTGGLKGSLLGSAVGAAGLTGASALGRGPNIARLSAGQGPIAATARFGQRQLHGFTGWTPEEGLQSIRGGAWGAKKQVADAREALAKAHSAGVAPKKIQKLEAALQQAEGKYLPAAQEAERQGLTSLPGYARALTKSPTKALRTGMAEQWHSMDPMSRALMFGWPVAGVAHSLATEGAPEEGSKLERAGKQLGTVAYTMGPLPIMSQLALQPALSAGLGRMGRLMSRRPTKEPPSPPGPIEPGGGMTQPEETIYSDRTLNNL